MSPKAEPTGSTRRLSGAAGAMSPKAEPQGSTNRLSGAAGAMSPKAEPQGSTNRLSGAEGETIPDVAKPPERFEDRAFAQQEAALQRVGAQLRAANAKIEGIKQQLQASISPKSR